MEKIKIVRLLRQVQDGRISVDEAFCRLRHLPFEDLGFAKVDHHRRIRNGFPEVVFCEGKTLPQIEKIFSSLRKRNLSLLLTRVDEQIFQHLRRIEPRVTFHPEARMICLPSRRKTQKGKISVICAGTADIPFAEEAAVTAEIFGNRVERVYDVGVAGLHRLLAQLPRIRESRCVVVLAGMEGALASVVGGLLDCPVVAVPTAVGYGANFQGITPLLTMLNSCAPNVTVVNVNNGFGAGYVAALINRR